MVSGLFCDFMYCRVSIMVSVGVAALSFVQHSCILCGIDTAFSTVSVAVFWVGGGVVSVCVCV